MSIYKLLTHFIDVFGHGERSSDEYHTGEYEEGRYDHDGVFDALLLGGGRRDELQRPGRVVYLLPPPGPLRPGSTARLERRRLDDPRRREETQFEVDDVTRRRRSTAARRRLSRRRRRGRRQRRLRRGQYLNAFVVMK